MADESIAGSYFNGNLYVSNDEDAHNEVRVTAQTGTLKAFAGANGEIGAAAIIVDGATTNQERGRLWQPTMRTVPRRPSRTIAAASPSRWGCRARILLPVIHGNNAANNPAPYMATFEVIEAGDEQAHGLCVDYADTDDRDESMGKLPARHGDTLTVTVNGVSWQRRQPHGRRRWAGVLRDLPG